MYLVKAKAVVSKLRRQVKQFESRAVGRSENLGRGRGALCFEWGFTQTFPGNQDVAVK